MKRIAARAFMVWFPLAVMAGVLALVSYTESQQVLRMSADQPQVALAQSAAGRLDAGAQPEQVVGAERVDLATSLDPLLIVYNADGRVSASGASLAGQVPQLPDGVLQSARSAGSRGDRITWQPAAGVRIATVAVPYREGYVVAGRSLAEVERQIDNQTLLAVAGLAVALGLGAVAAVFGSAVYEAATAPACPASGAGR